MRIKRHFRTALFAFAALLAHSPAASAGDISGKVVLSGERTASVVVSIEGLKVEYVADQAVYVIDHQNLNFVPHVLAVRVGATVQFKNSDGMPCRIYSISPAGVFVLGRQDSKPMTVTFDRPGVIEIRCVEHSRIYAYVVVKENPLFALTDARGRYEISNVSPGRYTLQIWYEGAVVKSRTITVGTKRLNVDFRASRPQAKAREKQALDQAILNSTAKLWPDFTHP